MIDFIKINPRSKNQINSLIKLEQNHFKSIYQNILPHNLFIKLYNFISSETLKEKIILDNQIYYFMYSNDNLIGYFEYGFAENELHIEKIEADRDYLEEIILFLENIKKENNLLNLTIYIPNKNQKTIDLYKNLGFKEKSDKIKYLGSDFYINVLKLIK